MDKFIGRYCKLQTPDRSTTFEGWIVNITSSNMKSQFRVNIISIDRYGRGIHFDVIIIWEDDLDNIQVFNGGRQYTGFFDDIFIHVNFASHFTTDGMF